MRNPECKLCLRGERAATVCMWGTGATLTKPKVMFILDSPNGRADFRGYVLDPDLYTWMKNICTMAGLRPGVDTYITYAVKCGGTAVQNGKPKAKEIKACQPYLWEEISTIQPEFVICMGAAAIKAMYGKSAKTLKQIRNRITKVGIRLKTPEGERVTAFKMSATYSPRILAESPQLVIALAKDVETIIGKVQHESVNRRYTTNGQPVPVLERDMGFDIETEGFIPYDKSKNILTAAIAGPPGRAHGVVLGHPEAPIHGQRSTNDEAILHSATQAGHRLFGHSIKFDLLWWTVKKGPVEAEIFDTKVAHSLLDENAPDNSLKYLAATLTDLGHYGDDVDRANLRNEPLSKVLEYNNQDSDASLRVGRALEPALKAQGMRPLFEFLMRVEKVLVDVEATGVWIDKPWAVRAGKEIYAKMKVSEEDIYRLAGREINLDSPKQKVWFLYEHMGLPILQLTKGGDPSTDKTALVALRYVEGQSPAQKAATAAMSSFSSNNKLWKGYFVPLPELIQYDQRVHTTYNLGRGESDSGDGESGAKTGRLSSSNPNLQNISILPLVRGMFAATDIVEGVCEDSDWEFVGADYSQLELRVGAFLAQASAMIRSFKEGKDFHNATLSDVTGIPYEEILAIVKDKDHPQHYEIGKVKRVGVKRVNFGVFYGIGHRKLAKQLLAFDVVMDELEVKKLMEQWFEKNYEVRNWIDQVEEEILRTGKSVTPTGRVRHLIGASRDTKIGMRMLRQGVNTPVQSFASEICLAAMLLLNEDYRDELRSTGVQGRRIILQVHDMIGVEYNKKYHTREQVIKHMKHTMEVKVLGLLKDQFGIDFNVPLVADVDAAIRWG